MENNNYYVYMYFDKDAPIYVGKGINGRCNDHLTIAIKTKRNTRFLNKIRKLLAENSPPTIKIIEQNLTEKEAFDLEKFLISQYGRLDLGLGSLLNLTNGGDGSSGHASPKKGKTFEEYFGKERSSEIREKIRQKALKRSDQIAIVNKRVHTGKKISQEQIEKTRAKNIGRKRSDETKRKISESTRGKSKTLSDEQIQAKSQRSKNLMQGTLIVNDGSTNKRIKPTELETYLSNGWIAGGKTFNRKKNTKFTISEKFLSTPRGPKPCEVNGKRFSTIKDAAIAYNTSIYMIKKDNTFILID
jgi:hypothetical protein